MGVFEGIRPGHPRVFFLESFLRNVGSNDDVKGLGKTGEATEGF